MADETKIIRIVIDSSRAVDGSREATRALEAIENQTRRAAATLEKMESGLDMAAVVAKVAIGAKIVKDMADRLLGLFQAARDAASAISDFSEQLGVSTNFVQASMFSAAQHTVALEKLSTGYTKATQTIGQAAQGQKDAVELFDRLGVKLLDAGGKLRGTEGILQDSAAAILKIDDPARRVAMAIDLFGKSGAQLIPILGDLASGSAAMEIKARAAGAMIEDGTLKQLTRLKGQAEETALKWNALVANLGTPITTEALERVNTLLGEIISQLNRGKASGEGFWATVLKDSRANGRIGSGPNALRLATPEEQAAYDRKQLEDELQRQWNPDSRAFTQAKLDKLNTKTLLDRQASMESEEAWSRRFQLPVVEGAPGAGSPVARSGGGETPAQRYAQLEQQLTNTAKAQREMTAAAIEGGLSFEKAKAQVDAQNKVLEIFKIQLADSDPRLTKVRDLLLDIARGKAAEAFAVATTELEQQNKLLETEISLIGQAPEIRASELALVKARIEAEKAGGAVTAQMLEDRRGAIEQNERLKIQAEQLKKAEELWTEPLKQALRDIQTAGANAFETMLEQGKFSFEELGQVFKKIVTRMIAEFLALATIRPVMSVIVNTISPGIAQQMGLGGGGLGLPSIGGGTAAGAGGSSLGGLFGGGGLGGIFSGLGDWLNTPFTGPYAGLSPSSMAGVPMLSPSLMNPSSWGITPLQGIGALAGAGMGAYQLINSRSTAGTIGGIASLVGAGVSLIPGIGQIAGPIISVLGSILPGLFESKPEPPTMRASAALNFSGGQFVSSGGAYGGASAIDLGGLGQAMKSLIDAAKVKSTSSPYGLMQQTYAKGDFSNATTFITGPGGQQMQWGQSSDPAMQKQAMDTAAAHVAHQIMMEPGSGISDILRRGLSKFGQDNLQYAFSSEELGKAVGEINAFEEAIKNLGKTTTSVQEALKGIDDRFQGLIDTGNRYGLDNVPIQAEKQKERYKVATDFATSIQDQLDALADPTGTKAAIAAATKEREQLVDNNRAIVAAFGQGQDQIVKIEALYAQKRIKIANDEAEAKTRAAEATVGRLQDLVRTLTPGGRLANVDPRSQLEGLRASYRATYAQAAAGDQSASARYNETALALAELSQAYNAGSPAYNRDRDEILANTQALQIRYGAQITAPGAANPGAAAVGQTQNQLLAVIAKQSQENAELKQQITTLLSRLSVYLSRPAA